MTSLDVRAALRCDFGRLRSAEEFSFRRRDCGELVKVATDDINDVKRLVG